MSLWARRDPSSQASVTSAKPSDWYNVLKTCNKITIKGTVHEKTFFPGKGALGPSEYESSKKNPIKIKQGAQN